MKARVKATGDVVEVKYSRQIGPDAVYRDLVTGEHYMDFELSFLPEDGTPDYWTRLEHQYAGMAMQEMIKRAYNAYCDDCANYENMIFEDAQALLKDHAEVLADVCVEFAHALVEKMKVAK